MERVAIAPAQMDEEQVSNLYTSSGASAASCSKRESGAVRALVFTTCIECVIKSRMTGDCHVRFCEQPRGEIPFG